VVPSGHSLADSGLHETRKRRQNVDRRVNTTVVKLSVDEDLALSDVARQVGNRVGNIFEGQSVNGAQREIQTSLTIVRHSQDRNLSD